MTTTTAAAADAPMPKWADHHPPPVPARVQRMARPSGGMRGRLAKALDDLNVSLAEAEAVSGHGHRTAAGCYRLAGWAFAQVAALRADEITAGWPPLELPAADLAPSSEHLARLAEAALDRREAASDRRESPASDQLARLRDARRRTG